MKLKKAKLLYMDKYDYREDVNVGDIIEVEHCLADWVRDKEGFVYEASQVEFIG